MTWAPDLIDTAPPADTLIEGAVKINANATTIAAHRGGSVSLDNRKRFLSGKLLVHAATWVGGKVLQ